MTLPSSQPVNQDWLELKAWLLSTPQLTQADNKRIADWIDEWQRLTSDWNTQHHAHHFPLDDHTHKVVNATHAAPLYQTLTPYQQWLTSISALLHDIEKHTGPARLHGHIPTDKLHPIKSAYTSLSILERLGCPIEDCQRVFTLIHHHQAFGQLFVRHGDDGIAPTEELEAIALKLRSTALTQCLAALSEGDIRSVQADNAFFTPTVETKLNQYHQTVQLWLRSNQPTHPWWASSLDPIGPMQHFSQETFIMPTQGVFVWPVDSPEHLQATLDSLEWGGCHQIPYVWHPLQLQPFGAYLLISWLPENLIYVGPNSEDTSKAQQHSMALLYSLFSQKPHKTLTSDEMALFNHCLSIQKQHQDMYHQLATENGFVSWTEWSHYMDTQLYGQATLGTMQEKIMDALLTRPFFTAIDPWIGLGTRPIIWGLLTADDQPWDTVTLAQAHWPRVC